jgi:hypothetical protein
MDRAENARLPRQVHHRRSVPVESISFRSPSNSSKFLVLPTLHTRLTQKPKSNGSPSLLFVTSAALRVVDVTRVLKDKELRGEHGGEVAKLFAKHFKLAEHIAYLRRTKVCAAVGTPGRIGKLLCETGDDLRRMNDSTLTILSLRCSDGLYSLAHST